jgi:hypothetical protein
VTCSLLVLAGTNSSGPGVVTSGDSVPGEAEAREGRVHIEETRKGDWDAETVAMTRFRSWEGEHLVGRGRARSEFLSG